jgi:DNA-binding NtrC family response regulator
VGRDPKMRQVFRLLTDVAATDATVLLEGQTGTGKELLAEEIHRHSPRRDKPFVVFDCGAVPKELIESALFGHVRGAFTGAVVDRRGAFVEAEGGTLFLDEIGELAPDMQPSLLRAIDRRMVRPVGGAGYQTVSVRVVAATNRDLRAEVAARRFREDLYYRVAVFRISVPPLRERPADIPLLVSRFIAEYGAGRTLHLLPDDLQRLVRHGWPGNVRELRNLIERACALSRGDALDLGDFFGNRDTPAPATEGIAYHLPFKEAKAHVVEHFERQYLQVLLERHGGNLSAAARGAEVDRKHLRELLRKHGLRESSE